MSEPSRALPQLDVRRHALREHVLQHSLKTGSFTLKSGRTSNWFLDSKQTACRSDGILLVSDVALAILPSEIDAIGGLTMGADPVAFGIAAVAATRGRTLRSFSVRKEAKDHGEGGSLVGAPVKGRVVIIDDVISAGTSVRESVKLSRDAGAEPAAVLIALDRMEKSGTATEIGDKSAVQAVEQEFGLPVVAIANLADLMAFLTASSNAELTKYLPAVKAYREKYGI